MKRLAIPIEFVGQAPVLMPADPDFYQMVLEFIKVNLVKPVNPVDLRKMWAVCEVDENDKPIRVTAVGGYVFRPDIPVFRSLDPASTKVLADRINDNLADLGFRGSEVFLYISNSESEESRCPQYKDSLTAFKAKPAERYVVPCR